MFAHAFREAGIDPEKGVLMPVDQQLSLVKKAVEQRFGVKVELPTITVRKRNLAGRMVSVEKTSLQTRKALDQLLNAYRQLQMLAHVMAMPEKGIGLPINGKPITLSLVSGKRLKGALGRFSWGGDKRVITLPDMSNSFAHEWGHALDHYLGAMADQPTLKNMLTRGMAGRGVTPPLSPKYALTDAFAHVMWSMFGGSSAAGRIVLQLQVEGAQVGTDGKPTPKAKRAQQIYADIRAGKTPPREYWSDYFKTSAEFDRQVGGDGYFTDPAEMFARAFEAMVGTEVAKVSDQPQAFLSKGEWAYSDTTDARAALTFPKQIDLQQFTLAMVGLQHAMARLNMVGEGPAAKAPDALDIMSTRDLLKRPGEGLGGLARKEMAEWGRTLDAMGNLPAGMRQGMANFGEGVDKIYSQAIRTGAATLFAVADRQENPAAREALTNIAKAVGKRPGNADKNPAFHLFRLGSGYSARSTGTQSTTANFSHASTAAPYIAIAVVMGDISGDLLALRVNGVQVAQSAGDQSAGNYNPAGTHRINYGAREGESWPFSFKGFHYGTLGPIVRFGANATADQIAAAEAYYTAETGLGA